MKTIKYLVDFRARRAGDVRHEEDGTAGDMIRRGFAEETTEDPAESGGDGRAIAQYHPDGSENVGEGHARETGASAEPAVLNAPGAVGINAGEGAPAEDAGEGA